jgi:hypothetical protein
MMDHGFDNGLLRLRLKKAHDFGDGWMASDGA